MKNNDGPAISVITPTFNRSDELIFLIRSLQAQTIDHSLFELIISDDGSTDDTEKIINEFKGLSDFPIKYLFQNNKGPGAARNLGLKNSTGELILFIDSDCEAHKNWIKILYDQYLKNSFDACGGPDASKADFSPLQKAIDYSMTSFFTTGGMRGHSKRMLAKFYPRTHNMGVKKNILNKVGGFSSLRHGQDIELSHKIKKTGAVITFIPNAIVYHRRRNSLQSFFKQTFNWGIARINLYKIDKVLLEPIHFLPSFGLITFVITIIFSVTGNSYFLKILELGFLLFIIQCFFGFIKHKDIRVFGLLLFAIPIQIFGYGLGFFVGFIKRVIFKSRLITGFTKEYYK